MSCMVRVFCACRGEKWRRLDSPDIVTGKHGIREPASGEPLSMSSRVLEGVHVARRHAGREGVVEDQGRLKNLGEVPLVWLLPEESV